MIYSDPFELLARLAPLRRLAPLALGDDITAEQMLTRIRAGQGQRMKRRKRWPYVAGVVALIAGATGAVTALRHESEPTAEVYAVSCYSEASATPFAQYQANMHVGSDPVEACALPWTNGFLGDDGPPPMQACINAQGLAVVVPGDEFVCQAIGLASYVPPTGDQLDALRLSDRLLPTVGGICVPEAEMVTDANDAVADLQLVDWVVEIAEPFTADRPCAEAVIDATTRTILIIAVVDMTEEGT